MVSSKHCARRQSRNNGSVSRYFGRSPDRRPSTSSSNQMNLERLRLQPTPRESRPIRGQPERSAATAGFHNGSVRSQRLLPSTRMLIEGR